MMNNECIDFTIVCACVTCVCVFFCINHHSSPFGVIQIKRNYNFYTKPIFEKIDFFFFFDLIQK